MIPQPDRVETILRLLADPNGQVQHTEALSDLGEVVGTILEERDASNFAKRNAGPDVRPRKQAADVALERATNAAFARLVLGQEP